MMSWSFDSIPELIKFLDKNNRPRDLNLNSSCSGGFRPRCEEVLLLAAGGTAGGD